MLLRIIVLLSAALALLIHGIAGCGAAAGGKQQVLWTDPESGETIAVFDGLLTGQLSGPPGADWTDGNWFDVPRTDAELAPYYAWAYGGFRNDPRLLSFLAAEGCRVVDTYDIGWVKLELPDGLGIDAALERYAAEYPGLFSALRPVAAQDYSGPYTPL